MVGYGVASGKEFQLREREGVDAVPTSQMVDPSSAVEWFVATAAGWEVIALIASKHIVIGISGEQVIVQRSADTVDVSQ